MECFKWDPNKSLLFLKGLHLLLECKVPNFVYQYEPDDRDRMFRIWSERFHQHFPQLIDFIEQNRKTLFYEQCGSFTWEFKKYFLLVYFEQVSLTYESAWFQMNYEIDNNSEYRLSKFAVQVDNILSRDSNRAIQCWLFHYYGGMLGMDGWEDREGEIYSFVRLFHFMVEYDRMIVIQFSPKILSFVEKFGKQLITCRKHPKYQMLGLVSLHSLMKHTCNKPEYFRLDDEGILELVLPLIWKDIDPNGENVSYDNLWNIIYYAARSMRVPNPSLDDQIMRTLLALLNGNESNIDKSHIYLVTLTRLFLLNVSEVTVEGPEIFSVHGKKMKPNDLRIYIKQRLQSEHKFRKCRYSFHWRLKMGHILPKLITRFVKFDNRCYVSRNYLEQLTLLVWVVMFPIGLTWHRQRAQATMLCCLLIEIEKTTRSFWQNLEQNPLDDIVQMEEWLLQHKVLVDLTSTIADAFLELMQYLQRSSEHTQTLIRNAILQIVETDNMLQNLNRTLERSINAVKKIEQVESIFRD